MASSKKEIDMKTVKEFIAEHVGFIMIMALVSMCMWSDCMRSVQSYMVPNARAGEVCEAVCGHGNVKSVSVSKCECK